MPAFLSTKPARILTIVLLLQCIAFYALANRPEPARVIGPLSSFPQLFGDWKLLQEGVIEKEIQDVLKADDIITRWYENKKSGRVASMFFAYFNSQRTGKAPHSPRNCMPGSGWVELKADRILIPIEGREPLEANLYIVGKGNDKSISIYWYQTSRRTVASEYNAKVYTVLDAIRYNRSDAAVIRVTMTVANDEFENTVASATEFIQALFPNLLPFFPV